MGMGSSNALESEITHPPASHPSTLESLPTEVIQLIFLHSLEINLARASPILSQALSNELIYTWLVRLAFSSTNPGSTTNFFTPDFLPHPLNFWSLSFEDRSNLQTSLLKCKWCTLPLIRKCQREYVHHAISRKCKELIFTPSDQETLNNLNTLFIQLDESCDKAQDGRKGKGDLVIPAQLPQSPLPLAAESAEPPSSKPIDRKLAIWLNFGAIQIREANEVYYENNIYRLPASPILDAGRIPNKLLRSPWTSSKFEFLQLLAPEFYLDEDEHDAERSGPITTRLIRQRRIEPFSILLGMYFRSKNCRVPTKWPLLSGHFALIVRCADTLAGGGGCGDPFARVVLDLRWDDVPVDVRGDLMRVVGVDGV